LLHSTIKAVGGNSGFNPMARTDRIEQAEPVLTDLLHAATAFVEWLSTRDPAAVLLFTFLSTAVEMTFLLGLLVPGESVVMLAGSLPAGPAGFALVVAVGTAGALSGQILGYAVGRVAGDRLRDTRLGRRIGAERFDRAEAYLRDRGAPALVAVRFVAVIHSVVPIVAGTARMPFGRFLGWSALGTVLWVSAFAGVGVATAGASSGGVALVLTAIGATCLGAVPIGARLIRQALPARRSLPTQRAHVAERSLPARRSLSARRPHPARPARRGLPARRTIVAAQLRPAPAPAVTTAGTLVAASSV
jgi:membrane-associated protein